MRRNIFISRFNQASLKETWNKKVFRFYSFDVKGIVTKKWLVTFCENIARREEKECNNRNFFLWLWWS